MLPGDAIGTLEASFAKLEQRGVAEFAAEGLQGMAHCTLDARYRRQGDELNVPFNKQSPAQSIAAFHQQHQQRYGFCDVSKPVEIVNLRLRMIAPGEPDAPAYRKPVPGDGSAACYAERPVHFACKSCLRATTAAKAWLPETPTRARDDYRIYFGDRITAGSLCASGWLRKPRPLDCRGGARMTFAAADPVELAIFQSAVHSIAEEMGAALRRTALGPNIKERRDYSCALF